MAEVPNWERIQKKTFTKWVNTHLKREYGEACQIEDIIADWETGINLMRLCVALYKENDKNPEQAVSMPKLKEKEMNPNSRIQKITNLNTALALMKQAGVTMRGVSAENLCDHEAKDKPTILGMVFTIILDYAARGFGGTSAEVKRALLEWVNQKTDGYERVNPPGVKNFTKDWTNGLAWCALIHRHRPDMINYEECLTKSNEENLETAFSVADEKLDIPRLLDVEDMKEPDEKSIITYTMEYFLRFASDGLKENAAKQAAEWIAFLRKMQNMQNDYEKRARKVLNWCKQSRKSWDSYDFGSNQADAEKAFADLRAFVTEHKPVQEGEKIDLEGLFAEIQSILKINGLSPYVPPEDVSPEQIEKQFGQMAADQSEFGKKCRENRFRFIEKKNDETGEEITRQIAESFKHYDTNNSQSLNATEFNAACMEMGIALKTEDEKAALFSQVAEGKEEVSFESYKKWMTSRLVLNLDNPASVKNVFQTIANGNNSLSEADMAYFSAEDKEFLKNNMNEANGGYDFNAFVDEQME